MSLTSLHEDLLVRISSSVATSDDYRDSVNLLKVSKQFNRISTDPCVLRSLSDSALYELHWRDVSKEKFEQSVICGNLEAMFKKGVCDIKQNQTTSGMEFLSKAASKGHERSTYLYGMLLISLDGENKPKGYTFVSPFLQKSVSDSEKRLEILREDVLARFWPHNPRLGGFKQLYVRVACRCNGETIRFLELDEWRRSNGSELLTADACQVCFWHKEVERFYKYH